MKLRLKISKTIAIVIAALIACLLIVTAILKYEASKRAVNSGLQFCKNQRKSTPAELVRCALKPFGNQKAANDHLNVIYIILVALLMLLIASLAVYFLERWKHSLLGDNNKKVSINTKETKKELSKS